MGETVIHPRVMLAVMLSAATATAVAQDRQVWINVLIKGKVVMGFLPAEDRSTHSSRGVCAEVEEAGARTQDGQPIRALDLTGWKEGEGYRVLVFAIVPARGEPGSQGLCSEGTGFKRVEFADLRVRAGRDITILKMRDAGMTPWVIRAGPKEPMSK
jgi:hypothetical protein